MISSKIKKTACMPGSTIVALIKKENMHCVSPGELLVLLDEFNRLNGKISPTVGQEVSIPILQKYADLIK